MSEKHQPEHSEVPSHGSPLGPVSRMEMECPDGYTRYDPATAHTAVGDSAYAVRLPESCWLCKAEALASAESALLEGGSSKEA